MSRTIAVPVGSDIRLSIRPPHHLVVAAPPGVTADLDALLAEPTVLGFFTFDPGVSWLDRSGCQWATTYLATGHAIVLQFAGLADALVAQKRLLASVGGRS